METKTPYTRRIPRDDVLAILFSAALMLGFTYFMWIMSNANLIEERFSRHEGIINNTAYFPYPYRVLVPFTMEGIIRVMTGVMPYRTAFLAAYTVYDLAVLYLILVSLYFFVREWFSRDQALIGTLFVAAVMAITLRDHGYQPWSFLEVSLFTYSLLLMHRKQYQRLIPIVVLAALNRETGVFIPLAFVLTQMDVIGILKREKPIPMDVLKWAALFFVIWAGIFGGMRLIRGMTQVPYSVWFKLNKNMEVARLVKALINLIIFQGFFWIFAVRGGKYAPPFLKRAVWVIPFYLVTVILYGEWAEVRLLMMLYPLLTTLGLSYIYHTRVDLTGDEV